MSNNRITLSTDLIESEFFSDTVLWAVGSQGLPDYHFGWLLNQHFGLNFYRKPELDIPIVPTPRRQVPAAGLFESNSNPAELAYFAVFLHQIPFTEAHAYLYHNIYGEQRLIPEMRHVDYFFLLPDHPDCGWIQDLTTLPKVSWAKQLDWIKIKSKQNFIL